MKKLKPHAVDWAQIERFLAGAEKKLASARRILDFDEEACLQQAYEAMLKASLGFMFSHGFLPWIRLRRKRNLALYDDTGLVSHHDAGQALEAAENYLRVIRANIATRKPRSTSSPS